MFTATGSCSKISCIIKMKSGRWGEIMAHSSGIFAPTLERIPPNASIWKEFWTCVAEWAKACRSAFWFSKLRLFSAGLKRCFCLLLLNAHTHFVFEEQFVKHVFSAELSLILTDVLRTRIQWRHPEKNLPVCFPVIDVSYFGGGSQIRAGSALNYFTIKIKVEWSREWREIWLLCWQPALPWASPHSA